MIRLGIEELLKFKVGQIEEITWFSKGSFGSPNSAWSDLDKGKSGSLNVPYRSKKGA